MLATTEKVFLLADCNNFYASCEQLFAPKLANRPVVVLSNNDGCVIARSALAKKLGFKMGDPYFKVEAKIRQHKVAVFSSNYALYADLSSRVMNVLSQFSDDMEQYSIDEAFLTLDCPTSASRTSNSGDSDYLNSYAKEIKTTVKQWTGIPVSIGVAPTKTLAKLANERAKKEATLEGVLNITGPDWITNDNLQKFLATFAVEDVWGIGARRAAFLKKNGIETALDLRNAPDKWILKHLTVGGLRTVWELRGISCLPLELAPAPKKGIACAKSFGNPVTDLKELKEAAATYTARVAEKLRAQHSVAGVVQVFLHTNYFRPNDPQYANSISVQLLEPTAYTPVLVKQVSQALERIYRAGYQYKKVGVMVMNIMPEGERQLGLWVEGTEGAATTVQNFEQKQQIMSAVDAINQKWGRDTLRVATAGKGQANVGNVARPEWAMQRKRLSPSYTTDWQQILKVRN